MNYSGYSSSPSAYPNYSEQLDANASAPSNAHPHSYTPIAGYPSQESPPKQMFNYATVQQQQQQPAAFYSQSEYGCYPNANPMPIGSVNPYGGGSMPYYYCAGQSTVASGTSLDEEARLDASETSADAGKVTRQRTPRKRQRLRKDPNEPQKPVSAYALFFRDTQAAIKGQNPNASFGEVSKIVAAMWDGLDSEAKNSMFLDDSEVFVSIVPPYQLLPFFAPMDLTMSSSTCSVHCDGTSLSLV